MTEGTDEREGSEMVDHAQGTTGAGAAWLRVGVARPIICERGLAEGRVWRSALRSTRRRRLANM